MKINKILAAVIALILSIIAITAGAVPAQAGLLNNLTTAYGDMVMGRQAPFQITYHDPAVDVGAKLDIKIQEGQAGIDYAIASELHGPNGQTLGSYVQEQAKLEIKNNQISYRDKYAVGIRLNHQTAYIRTDIKLEAGVTDDRF